MANLYFRYGTMFSGKSLEIFKIYDNYKRQGKKAICLAPRITNGIQSRVGLEVPSIPFYIASELELIVSRYVPLDCVLVEEVQFASKEHVQQLANVVDRFDIPVIAYGLKNTFDNELFDGSYWMLVYADKIEEIKTVCYFCNKKATMVLRTKDRKPVYEGSRIILKDEDESIEYFPVCRRCYKKPKFKAIEDCDSLE